MPVHDWTRVEDGIFHAFHVAWLPELQRRLNAGLLPKDFYALAEQHAGKSIADVLTLHASAPPLEPMPLPPDTGGTAVAEAPPRTRRQRSLDPVGLTRGRSLAIRHVSGHRLVAIMEIVSPANKDRAQHVEDFVDKVASALEHRIHVLIVDLFPPGLHDPQGLHAMIEQRLLNSEEGYDLPADEPMTLASYAVDLRIESYIEHVAVGAPLPEMPLFLRPDRYVNVPLESTYQAAYSGLPEFWREVLDKK